MEKETIAVLGGGNGAHMMAADFALRGHTVNFYAEFKEKRRKIFETRTIVSLGELKGTAKLNMVTDDIEAAVRDARYICIVSPAFAHEKFAKLLKGKVNPDQIVIAFPGAFASFQFRKVFGEEGCPILAEVNDLPYDTRVTAPGEVMLYGQDVVNIAFTPASAGPALIDKVRKDLFPFGRLYDDVLECGLAIVNPAWHTGPCMLSVTSIEHPLFDFYVYEHGWTPSACKLNIALDQERKAVGAAYGYHLTPLEDFTGMPEGYTWKQLYAAGHGSIALTPIEGPNSIDSRYLTEDVPYGLVPWTEVAKIVNVPMPMCEACINIYNVIHQTDWRVNGLTAERMGIDGLTRDQLKEYARTGHKG